MPTLPNRAQRRALKKNKGTPKADPLVKEQVNSFAQVFRRVKPISATEPGKKLITKIEIRLQQCFLALKQNQAAHGDMSSIYGMVQFCRCFAEYKKGDFGAELLTYVQAAEEVIDRIGEKDMETGIISASEDQQETLRDVLEIYMQIFDTASEIEIKATFDIFHPRIAKMAAEARSQQQKYADDSLS